MIYAAKLERFASGLERHSYDTEVAAYLDVCARLPDHTRALCVTDCLSGASADVRTPRLSHSRHARRHLARELDSLNVMQGRLRTFYHV